MYCFQFYLMFLASIFFFNTGEMSKNTINYFASLCCLVLESAFKQYHFFQFVNAVNCNCKWGKIKYLGKLMPLILFFQHTVVFDTAVIFAVIILLTYEWLRFIQSCPAPFFPNEREQFVKGCRRNCCFKSVLYYCKYVRKLNSLFTFFSNGSTHNFCYPFCVDTGGNMAFVLTLEKFFWNLLMGAVLLYVISSLILFYPPQNTYCFVNGENLRMWR